MHPQSRPSLSADLHAIDRALALSRDADRLAAHEKWPAALAVYLRAWRELRGAAPGPLPPLDALEEAAPPDDPISERERMRAARQHLADHLGALLAPQRAAIARLEKRLTRALLALAGLTALVLGGSVAYHAHVLRDLSQGAAWTVSSQSAGKPKEGTLPRRTLTWVEPPYFFHTAVEDNPWIEIDLGVPRLVRAVDTINRLDCCFDRASELVVELSNDRKTFEAVAQRGAPSPVPRRWLARFEARRARWVRVRAPRKTCLHLADVRVLGAQ